MRALKQLFGTIAVGCVAVALIAPAATAEETNTVAITDATVSGGTATVTGTATFAPIAGAQDVGGTNTNFANAGVADAAGINLTGAKIEPLADGAGVRFIWTVNAMPPEVPPEGVRYTWSFKIAETQFQLQAKRTNIVNATTVEDPVGHIQQVAAQKQFFQLRGACTTAYLGTPISGCYHLAFLNGKFDTANKTISIDLPYRTRDSIGRLVAPEFVPGAVLDENVTAGMSIAASFQAVVSNTTSSDFINGWNSFFTAPQVALGVGRATTPPDAATYSTTATLTGTEFSGTVTGLTTTNNTVFARACYGVNCVYTSKKVL